MRRVRLAPTLFGWKMLAFHAVNLVAFLATAYANLYFLMIAFLTLFLLASIVWTGRHARRLRVLDVRFEEPADAFGKTHLVVDVTGGAKPVFGVRVEVQFAGRKRQAFTIPLIHGRVQVAHAFEDLERGAHRVVRVRVTTSYPLGLWRAGLVREREGELVHPPRARCFEGSRERTAFLSEMGGELASGHGEVPASLRPYRDGDEDRRVSWRASARRGQRVVLEMEEERREGFAVVLDRNVEPSVFERALEEVVVLCETARREKVPVAFHTQGHDLTCGEGKPFRELARLLATLDPQETSARREPIRVAPHAVRFPRQEDVS